MRNSWRNSLLRALTLIILAGGSASAHRRDEYLQAARLAIDPARLELVLDLTPGIAVAEDVLAQVDAAGDTSISTREARSYAERVLDSIAVDVDGTPVVLVLIDSAFPEVDDVRNGEGTLRVNAAPTLPPLSEGLHHLRYQNNHRPDIGVYLANALVPASDRMEIASQQRDVGQRGLTIEYRLRADLASRVRGALSVGIPGTVIGLALVWWRRGARWGTPVMKV